MALLTETSGPSSDDFIEAVKKDSIWLCMVDCSSKQRQTIEQGFKTYDDALLGDSSYMHSDASFEAWLFLSQLSMMMGYDAMNEIYKKD